jgi:hypothetical protein
MVDLPQVRNDVPVLRAPTSPVSPSQIAQPYAQVSALLEEAGKETEAVAKPLARQAGIEAVTRDADGNMQVERLPIVGPAAEDFSRAVKWTAFATSAGEARRHDLVIAREYQNDPDGYLKAADAFRKDYVAKIAKVAGPEVGVELSRSIDGITTQQFNSILAQQQAKIRRDFDQSTTARIRDAQVDLTNLITTGGMDTPAGVKQANQLINTVVNTLHARSANQILGVPPEVTATLIKEFDQSVGASLFAAGIRKIVNDPDGGIEKAQAAIDANFANQSIPATQRVQNREVATDTIRKIAQDQVRAATLVKKQQEQIDEAGEDAALRSVHVEGEKGVTEEEIAKSSMSVAAKKRAIAILRRDGLPEPLAKISERASEDVFRRMQLPEGDPNKITSLGQITEMYAPADGTRGALRRNDLDWLVKTYREAKSASGESLAKERALFFKQNEDKLVPGDGRTFLAIKEAERREELLRAQGKDPHLVYDPGSDFYFGDPKNIGKYRRSLDTILKEYRENKNITGPGREITNTTIENRFAPPNNWQFSPSRKQYRDPATGKVYDLNGKEVQ